MFLHMVYVRILRVHLFFVRHVDEHIEPAAIGIAFDDRLKLQLMKLHQVANGLGKFIKQAAGFFTIRGRTRCSRVPVAWLGHVRAATPPDLNIAIPRPIPARSAQTLLAGLVP